MGRAQSKDTLIRQWEMLKLLPSKKPGITASEITKALENRGFYVDKNTVTRNLNMLASIFPLECNDKGVAHGWYWTKDASLDLPALTISDALSFRLLEEYLKSLLPASILSVLNPRFKEARRKLAELAESNTLAAWSDKVRVVPPTLPLLPPVLAKGVLENVQEALMHDVQIECQYRSAEGKVTTQRLHPLALVQRGLVTYLVATAFAYQDPHLYALHRFRNVVITEDEAEDLKGFNIDAYIASGALQYGNGKTLRLKASIDEYLAMTLTETPLSEDMQIKERAEDYLLTATVADSPQLRWWLLSWGEAVEVLGPKGLREEIAGRVLDMHCAYWAQ